MGAKTSKSSKRFRVLVVDHYPLCAYALAELIRAAEGMELWEIATSQNEVLDAFDRGKPEVVVIEIATKGGHGLELVKQIKTWHPDLPILVISTHDERYYADRSLQAGASGYISKEAPLERVEAGIRSVASGQVFLSDSMKERLLARKIGRANAVSEIERLTDRELQVFELIGEGHSTREIAGFLHLSAKTVETYYDRIKKKLGLSTYHALIPYAVLWKAKVY